MDKESGCGSMETFRVKSGMDVCIADFNTPVTVEKRFEKADPSLRFYFYISAGGHWEFRSPHADALQNNVCMSDRVSTILYLSESEGKKYWQGEHRQFHVSARITPSMLSTYLGRGLDEFPKDLRAISEGCTDRIFSHVGPLSRAMSATIQQLLDCPYHGRMKELFIESKALELIVHKLVQTVSSGSVGRPASSKFDAHEMGRIQLARDLLCRDLERPPKLIDLVRAAGMNHCRLNKGFREVYGATVFGYLKQVRLLEARRLLEKEGMNVTEAALSVGYGSISSFSNAFFEYFGLRPVACLKKKPRPPHPSF